MQGRIVGFQPAPGPLRWQRRAQIRLPQRVGKVELLCYVIRVWLDICEGPVADE